MPFCAGLAWEGIGTKNELDHFLVSGSSLGKTISQVMMRLGLKASW